MRLARFAVASSEPRYAVVEGLDDDAVLTVIEGDPLYRPVQPTGERVPLRDARLLAPVIPRSKIVGVGRNYAEHAAESGADVPHEPLLFLKPNTSVVGPGESVVLPAASARVEHEAELAVVIGRLCKQVPRDRVADVVLGYTCADDVTARDLQRRDGQWSRAKGFDTFCPLGPWISTDLDPSDQQVECRVDGEVRQRARTSEMVHDVASLVSFVSSVFTLLPGDVILTGTPAGVGPLHDGQTVEVQISGLGTLVHTVTSPTPSGR